MKLITTHPDSNSIPLTWQQTGGIIFEGGIKKLGMKSTEKGGVYPKLIYNSKAVGFY